MSCYWASWLALRLAWHGRTLPGDVEEVQLPSVCWSRQGLLTLVSAAGGSAADGQLLLAFKNSFSNFAVRTAVT